MLTNATRWSLGRGRTLVPSRWQATDYALFWSRSGGGQRHRSREITRNMGACDRRNNDDFPRHQPK